MPVEAQGPRVFFDNVYPERMKSADKRNSILSLGVFPNFRDNPVAHFLGRFIGESNSQNFIRLYSFFDQIHYPVGYRFGLPRPRPGDNKKRPLLMNRRLFLLII